MLDSKRHYNSFLPDGKKRLYIYLEPGPSAKENLNLEDLVEVSQREFSNVPLSKLLVIVVQEPDQIIIFQE